jgi:hypothetical protein
MPVRDHSRGGRRRSLLAVATAAAAALLLLATAPGAAAQQQPEPLPNVVASPGGHRSDAALSALLNKMQQPLATQRGCATPHPTPSQIAAAAEAVRASRARRVAAGQVASASAFKDSLVGKPPTVIQTYFHVVYPVTRASDLNKNFPNNTYGGDGELMLFFCFFLEVF